MSHIKVRSRIRCAIRSCAALVELVATIVVSELRCTVLYTTLLAPRELQCIHIGADAHTLRWTSIKT